MGRPLSDDAELPIRVAFATAVPVAIVVRIRRIARTHGTTITALAASALEREADRIERGGQVP